MLGNLLLTFGANYFKGKARREKEKRDLAEKKLEEKRAMDNAISLFQTKLDIQTQAESEADRLAEEKVNDKKFKEIQNIFKEDATNMAEYYGIDTALEIGQNMQERAINSGQSVKDMYNINRIENVQPNMDTLKGIAEDNRGITVQTTDAFQTATFTGIDSFIKDKEIELAEIASTGVNIYEDEEAQKAMDAIRDYKKIANITAVPKGGLTESQLTPAKNRLEEIALGFFPDLGKIYTREEGFRPPNETADKVNKEIRLFNNVVTQYLTEYNDLLITQKLDSANAFAQIQKRMEQEFKKGSFAINSSNTELDLGNMSTEKTARVEEIVRKLKSTNDTDQVKIYKQQLLALGVPEVEVDNF